MIAKGLAAVFLLLFALLFSGCSLDTLFGRAEAPLILASPAPENPQEAPTSPSAGGSSAPESTLPSDVLGTLEESTPSPHPPADEESPAEIATSTTLLKVPTPTPTPTPIPTPERPKLEIKSSSIKLSDDGQKYLIEGQLSNRGRRLINLTDFKIVVYLYDKNGQRLASAVDRPASTTLQPWASTAFKVTVDYILGVDTYKVQGGY